MKFLETTIEGLSILEPCLFSDDRGYFFEAYNQRVFNEQFGEVVFVQDNESKSSRYVVRGLHFQKPPFAQAKLVRVIKGAILDVAVDIRVGSPTYGEYVAVELSEENKRQFYIPSGFAHGFSVLSEEAIVQYKCDNFYNPSSEGALLWNDSSLDIDWRIPHDRAIISAKDVENPSFEAFKSPFLYKKL